MRYFFFAASLLLGVLALPQSARSSALAEPEQEWARLPSSERAAGPAPGPLPEAAAESDVGEPETSPVDEPEAELDEAPWATRKTAPPAPAPLEPAGPAELPGDPPAPPPPPEPKPSAPPRPPPPAQVGHVRASSQLEAAARPARFAPILALDGRPSTVWCEGAPGDGTGERLIIGFKRTVRIDSIEIRNGDARSEKQFLGHHRVRRLVLREASSKRTLTLADGPEPQSARFEPPLEAERVELVIEEVTRGDGADDAACLADVLFYSEGRRIPVASVEYHRERAALMGAWFAGPRGAPDRFLDLYADGTFRYLHRPFDPELPVTELSGDYEVVGRRLRFRFDERGMLDAAARWRAEPDRDGLVRRYLEIGAAELEGSLGGSWTDRSRARRHGWQQGGPMAKAGHSPPVPSRPAARRGGA
jgi:hypothetical protein